MSPCSCEQWNLAPSGVGPTGQILIVGGGAADDKVALAAFGRLGLATRLIEPAGLHAAHAELRHDLDAGPIGLGGIGLGATAALDAAAALEGELTALIVWNGRFDPVEGSVERLEVPSLLLLDRSSPRRERRAQRQVARSLGPSSRLLVARSLHLHADELVREWYLEATCPRCAPSRRPSSPVIRRGAVGLAAVAVIGVPAAMANDGAKHERFASGKRVPAHRVAGDGFSMRPPAWRGPALRSRLLGTGRRVRPNRVHGDGFQLRTAPPNVTLIDSGKLKWTFNTNVSFATSSSASGAAFDAAFTASSPVTTMNGGTVMAKLTDAFDGYNGMAIGTTAQNGPVSTGAYTSYNQNGAATTECSGRQYVFNPQVAGPITMSRKVYVPSAAAFARWMNIFTNTSGAPVTIRMFTSNNLGSDSSTVIFATSSGDTTFTTGDTWFGSFQNYSGTTSSDVRLGHIIAGPGAAGGPALVFPDAGDDKPFWAYDLTIPAGATQIVVNYAIGRTSKAAVSTDAAAIAANPPMDCMSGTEISQVVNFAQPSSGGGGGGGGGGAAVPVVSALAPQSGAAGTAVGITGDHFEQATAVLFGGQPAAFVVDGFKHITAIAPAGVSGAVDVTVVNGAGTSATSAADQFTFSTPATPPTGGTTTPTGKKVLCPSLPNLKGHTYRGSLRILARAGCTIRLEHRGHARHLPSHVKRQNWPPGTVLREGDRLIVRLG